MTDIPQWLFAWFEQRAPEVKLCGDDNYFKAGAIDSFGVIELIEDLEVEFKLRFAENDFQDRRFPTIYGLAAIIAEKQLQ